jgi:hypothetical protein
MKPDRRHTSQRISDSINAIKLLVAEQAEDEGLWFIYASASEAYLQRALRRLHAAIESEFGEWGPN